MAAGDAEIAYGAFVLATGSRPVVPPVPGNDLDGCHVYRTFDDLDAIRAAAGHVCGVSTTVGVRLDAEFVVFSAGIRPRDELAGRPGWPPPKAAVSRSIAAAAPQFVLDADARTLLGGALVGDTSAYPLLAALVGHELPARPEHLLR